MRVDPSRGGDVVFAETFYDFRDDVRVAHVLHERLRLGEEPRPPVIDEEVEVDSVSGGERGGGGESFAVQRRAHRGKREKSRRHRLEVPARHLENHVHRAGNGGDDSRAFLDASRANVGGARRVRRSHRRAHGHVELVHVHPLPRPLVRAAFAASRRRVRIRGRREVRGVHLQVRGGHLGVPSPGEVHAFEIARLRDSKFVRFGDVHHPRRRSRASARVRADGDVEGNVRRVRPRGDRAVRRAPVHPERSNVLGDDSRAASKRPARVQTDQRDDAVAVVLMDAAVVLMDAVAPSERERARDDARRRERGFVPRRGRDGHRRDARLGVHARLGEEYLRRGVDVGVVARTEDDERASRGAALHGNDATRRAGKRHLVHHRARPRRSRLRSQLLFERREAQPRAGVSRVRHARHREVLADARNVARDVFGMPRAGSLDRLRVDAHVRADFVVVLGERLRRLFPLGASRRARERESTVGEEREDAFATRHRLARGSCPREFDRGRRESNLRRAHRRGKFRATHRRDACGRAVNHGDGPGGGYRRVPRKRVFLHQTGGGVHAKDVFHAAESARDVPLRIVPGDPRARALARGVSRLAFQVPTPVPATPNLNSRRDDDGVRFFGTLRFGRFGDSRF